MKEIVIAPLSTPQTMTVAAWEQVRTARHLFLQTERHPSAEPVKAAALAYVSMDDLYDAATDFDSLNAAVADRLTKGTSCVYAVMGGGCYGQTDAIERAARERGFAVRVLAGVAYGRAAFPAAQEAVTATANALGTPDPSRTLVIEELDNAILAGDCKLALLEYYPASHPVTLATLGSDGVYRRRTFPLEELDRQKRYGAASVLLVEKAGFSLRDRYGYDDLLAVMRRLRAPGGCPWDREQTHESLKSALVEECYELYDAIGEGDDAHIIEELGDVLLQVAFHAVIGEEQGRFTARDVSDGIVKKLVYRHPHIFGDVTAATSDEVLKNWDALKKKEKRQQTEAEVLNSVPRGFPALLRAQKVQTKAGKVGYDFASAADAFEKVREEADELAAAMRDGGDIAEEAGDLLFAAVNVSRLLGLDAESLLHAATAKFICRFACAEAYAAADGTALNGLAPDKLDEYWEKAKKNPTNT